MTKTRLFAAATRALAVLLLPVAFLRAPGSARYLACQWALAVRFPREDLRGLAPAAEAAFRAARTEAFWRDRQLLGVTSGHRDAAVQHWMFTQEIRRTGSPWAAMQRVLPPERSAHVAGIAMDVRPSEGARWLEAHGWRFSLYRTYDNEWWHFEYRVVPPVRLPYPGYPANDLTVPMARAG